MYYNLINECIWLFLKTILARYFGTKRLVSLAVDGFCKTNMGSLHIDVLTCKIAICRCFLFTNLKYVIISQWHEELFVDLGHLYLTFRKVSFSQLFKLMMGEIFTD